MATLADMKARIALELRRDDLTVDIANAINSAIAFYQYDRFPSFNVSTVQAAPANDTETGNPWMNIAEPMIRSAAKAILYLGVMREPQIAQIYSADAKSWEMKLKTPQTFQTLAGLTAGTLQYMKARIANELERGDLTTEIANAISASIGYYQNERFYFNETRDITFNTVANQWRYTSADDVDLATLVAVDYVFAYIGGQPYKMKAMQPDVMDWTHLDTNDPVGQPSSWGWYSKTLQIYPTPDKAYKIRIGGCILVPAPATDVTTGNMWMTDAEPMIRARAKYELYAHVPAVADAKKAADMIALAGDAYINLKNRTVDLTNTGGEYIVDGWGY